MRWRTLLSALLLPLAAATLAAGIDDDDEDDLPNWQPGLRAEYRAGSQVARRIETAAQFVWDDAAPDPRLPVGPFQAVFTGHLRVLTSGEYRLALHAAGKVQVWLDGQPILSAATAAPQWCESPPRRLGFGEHALRIEFEKTLTPASLGLYWEGPGFRREPIGPQWLVHQPDEGQADRFARGEVLQRALRCAACHAIPGQRPTLPAPDLTRLAGNVRYAWLVERLQDGSNANSEGPQSARRMPHFGLTRDEAQAVAAYLLARSLPARPTASANNSNEKPAAQPDARRGRALLRSVGCLACHTHGTLGTAGLFDGGNLAEVSHKRPSGFVARWLADAKALNADARMPHFPLSAAERADLAAYLEGEPSSDQQPAAFPEPQVQRGAELVQQYRCGACHRLPGNDAPTPAEIPFPAGEDFKNACFRNRSPQPFQPRYHLAADAERALAEFVRQVHPQYTPSLTDRGRWLLQQHHCVDCHARGPAGGLAAVLPGVVEAEPDLAELLPALAPPALHGVGDKLTRAALGEAIAQKTPPRRPWLRVRMPRFELADDDLAVLVETLVQEDRMPALPDEPPELNPTALALAGRRLVTADGFGCTSCHAIGDWTPRNVALKAQGTNLSDLGHRIRRAWYDRWVRNPARLVPRMEMPAITVAVRGVLDEQLDAQLAAVWHVLNQPGFQPPPPDAHRILRQRHLADTSQRSRLLMDVLEIDGRPWTKPLLIALPNRHNVLLDLEHLALAGWWIGDAARQHTRGKTWYWEPSGTPLVPFAPSGEWSLVLDGRPTPPLRQGQFVTEVDRWEHRAGSVLLEHRLRFPAAGQPRLVHVRQTFSPWESPGGSLGFQRRVQLDGLAAGEEVQLRPLPAGADVYSESTQLRSRTDGPLAVAVAVLQPADAAWAQSPQGPALRLAADPSGKIDCLLQYTSAAPVDRFPLSAPEKKLSTPQVLDSVVPGWEAVALPLPREIMPTGLAWRDDGTLVIASLEGRVWLAQDRDGDGLEDHAVPFSDELPCPYGVATAGGAIDVVTKHALLRLHDDDGDGAADRTETLASGWGHTPDYHDWAVGLPRDAAGNYYIALSCQQDDRSPAAAHLRGCALRLVPRTPTADNPHRYTLETLCGGLRFPMGLALNAAGDLFATDNQGNYNPFNELNHLLPGRRYGFINRLEFKQGVRNQQITEPAVAVPHPWTRSVNGIGFLVPPGGSGGTLPAFGPLTGHLIGCEYDTRRLVRITLQRVGDTYQGAVYPFSTIGRNDSGLLGPLVCQVGPQNDLYVGNIRDSGWGGGQNTGQIVRLRPRGELPLGLAEVTARRDGFLLRFTQPIAPSAGEHPEWFVVESFRRITTPDYGGPDVDRRRESPPAIDVSSDCREVFLRLQTLREGFVYEFQLDDRLAGPGGRLFPAEAFYTLRAIPP